MKVRGTRECRSCGTRWSYYETGSVECPDCGSMRSVGVEDERKLHTATNATLDLSPVRNAVEEVPLRDLAERAVEATREFTRSYGFVDGGDLRPLDDRYLAAMELRAVADAVGRGARVSDDEELYFLSLLRGDLGDRPAPDEVPDALRDSRGLAYANAVDEYRSDARAYLDEHPDPAASDALARLDGHVRRVQAIQGDVPPAEAETLVRVARGVGRYLREDDEAALAEARSRLDALD
ncbi:DUF7117 family protein [Halosegnis marinus]|uniref:TFIIB-type zinc ribbon-containing protein n=1 Tax=Halosegnis marinus TaxID=3034023 RepID=A0ABD5ZT68_9EURY|nr:TFIIB-type zinc ribbon-containing protein [Halosegnis sp. DT85]